MSRAGTPFRILSWNVNSVRRRLPQIARVVRATSPDVLCLQETKVRDAEFPRAEFSALGYDAQAISGQPAYNGVAILSRQAFTPLPLRSWRGRNDKRHIAVRLDAPKSVSGLELHCFYVPSGGGVPDRTRNDKFDDKLRFMESLTRWSKAQDPTVPRLLVGDFNIAWLEHDVWNHKAARRAVGHTDLERAQFSRFMEAGGWYDLQRRAVPAPKPYYTWWTYRYPQAHAQGRGWRLDYTLANQACLPWVAGVSLYKRARGWKTPSDHAPVLTDFARG